MSLLQVRNLDVTFDINPRGAWPWTPPLKLQAVKDMSFDLEAGQTLGVVGESGSGKSTLARAIVGTVPSSGGEILWEGRDLRQMSPRDRRRHRGRGAPGGRGALAGQQSRRRLLVDVLMVGAR